MFIKPDIEVKNTKKKYTCTHGSSARLSYPPKLSARVNNYGKEKSSLDVPLKQKYKNLKIKVFK